MNLILCDDEPLFLSSLKEKIVAWGKKTGHSSALMINTFTSGEDLLDALEHGVFADALFLDIQIPGEMSGLAVAKEIYSRDENMAIVFVTYYGEYAEEGYTVGALRYLRKPVSDTAIEECMDVLWRRWELSNAECLLLDLPTQMIRLPLKAILYLAVSGHYCVLYTDNARQEYRFKKPLDEVQKELPEHLFVRCHRSFIVNLMYIRHIARGCITMANGAQVPIGKVYQPQLMHQFRRYYLGEEREE